MRKLMLLILVSFISQWTIAQVEVQGVVKDEEGFVSFASVVVKDSTGSVVAYDISDDQGDFLIDAPAGVYLLEVSIVGYQLWQQELNLEKNTIVDDVLLESAVQELGEVVVKSKVPLFERKPDRLVFNVDQSIAAKGGDALDALRVAPGLQIENDAINMLGKGASAVMIDGRLLQLSGEDLISFLNSISSDDIKKIEIISNPPAKYEAAGNGGLINIIYKKGVGNYWKNSSSFSATKNAYHFFRLGNNFLYSKDKLKFTLNVNGSLGDSREIETWRTDFSNGPRETFIDAKKEEDKFSGRASVDYTISPNMTVGVQYIGNLNDPDRDGINITNIFNTSNAIDSIYETSEFVDRRINSHIYNAYLFAKLDTLGRSIYFDVGYFDFDNQLDRDYLVNTLSGNGDFLNVNQSALNLSDQSIKNYAAKIDIEHPLKALNLSYGAKVSFTKTVNDLRNFNTVTGEDVFDPTLSNVFKYDENVQAIYVNGSKSLSKKLEIQVGLRLENTLTTGFSETLDETTKNDYLKLFPTFYLSYQKNEDHNLSFNYGRRIFRPWFRNLNPFRIYNNSNNYSEGNPFLQPSFNDNLEFVHSYKGALSTKAFFSMTSNGAGTIFSADDDTNIQAIIRRNFYTSYSYGVGEVYRFDRIPWWYGQNSIYVIRYQADIFEEFDVTPRNGVQLYFDTYNTFTLNKTTKLQVDFFYSSRYKAGLSELGERYGLDLGVKKSFLDGSLYLSLFAKDIFDTGSLNNQISEVNGVEVNFGLNYSRRYLRLSLSYDFGNNKIRHRQRRFGNDEESRRAN